MATAVLEQTLKAPLGAFTDDVTDDRGRVNVRLLAHALDLPMTTIAPALDLKPRWLNQNPTGQTFQGKAIMLLELVNELASVLGGKKYVALYLKTAQPDFAGATPADQLKKGRLQYLRTYVNDVVTMRPD
jgi:hypothetical protein